MSQVPPPPQNIYAAPPPRKLSITAMLSFICGILGCVPFITGILAVLLGLMGLVSTHNPRKSGRWMAILGLVLGILSIGGWSLFGGGIWALVKGTEGPRIAAHDFIRDVSAGNDAAAKGGTLGMTDADYTILSDEIHALGTFKDTTFFSTNIHNDSADVTGIATFDKVGAGSTAVNVHSTLQKSGGAWKVEDMTLSKP